MKIIATFLLWMLSLGMTGYLTYAWGETRGREAAREEINAHRIFPEMYETLEEEHRALLESQMESLRLIDFCDSVVETLKESTMDDVQDFRMQYILMRSRMEE